MTPPPSFTAVYKTVDSLPLTTDIYLPSGTGARPVAILIHGGAFIIGSSRLATKAHISDCLARGWLVAAPNYRLAPQADLRACIVPDARDHLAWVAASLSGAIAAHDPRAGVSVDARRIVAVGESAGGTLALALAFGPTAESGTRPAAIIDFYGAKAFRQPCWDAELPALIGAFGRADQENEAAVQAEAVRATGAVEDVEDGGVRYDAGSARFVYAMRVLGEGRMLRVAQPDGRLDEVDPLANVDAGWPPVWIVHGTADSGVPMDVSVLMARRLREGGVRCRLVEVPGEEHTFLDRMVEGSEAWRLQRGVFDEVEELLKGL